MRQQYLHLIFIYYLNEQSILPISHYIKPLVALISHISAKGGMNNALDI